MSSPGIRSETYSSSFLTASWFSPIKNEFKKSHLVSNTVFCFLLVCLEGLTEMEFWCPCDSQWNVYFSAAFFTVPALLVFLVMLSIRGCRERLRERLRNMLFCMVPSVVWLILLFFDGQYLVCAKTSWSGSYVALDGVSSKRWCKPDNQSTTQELQKKSERWVSESQVIGMGFVLVLTFGLGIHLIYTNCKKEDPSKGRLIES